MAFFAFVAVRGAVSDYMQSGEAINVFAYPSILIFAVIAIATFCMTLSAFMDKILDAIQSPTFHPVLKLVGMAPATPPKSGRSASRKSFFDLNSWQLGGILAALLFVAGLGWYHWSWLAGRILESCTHQLNDAIPQLSR